MNEARTPRMTSHRPYLLRALYEWIADNGMTPHLLVDAAKPGVQVPASAVSDGQVVLNIADRAVAGLDMGNEAISFTARFGGVGHRVSVPVSAVLAMYARETGQGMALPEDMPGAGAHAVDDEVTFDGGDNLDADDAGAHERTGASGDGDDTPPSPKRGHLRVVK